mmetsp:Transcript_7292/g.16973  ORF Transcript_7292/g.16973 Transcript_7292/m.16973 type:complete len:390 (+) Transcript_7292:87-1256(+)
MALNLPTHCFLLFPSTPSAILLHRSFLSMLAGYFLSMSWSAASCASVHSSPASADFPASSSFPPGAAAGDGDEVTLLNCAMHSSFPLGSCCLHRLLMKSAIDSHLFAPPAGYFFTALASAASSSFVHGLAARAAFASRAFSSAAWRLAFRCCILRRDCRSAPAAVSTAHCLTSASAATFTLSPGPRSSLTASAPPRRSLRLVSSIASSLSQSSSMSSFMPSRSSQTAESETEPSFGLADWYAAMVSLRKSCLALRSCFFCCSLIFLASFFLDSSTAFALAAWASAFSLSTLSLSAFSSSALLFASSFSFFSLIFLSFSLRSLGSAAMALSTSRLILAISSLLSFFIFRSTSCFIHRFSSRQSALSRSCSVSFSAASVKSLHDSKCVQKS